MHLVLEFPYVFQSSFGLMLDCHSGILLFLRLFCLSSRSVFHSQLNVYFRIETQLHRLLSQKHFQVCFHFSRINSKHGQSPAGSSATPSLQCDEPAPALSSVTQGHWFCLPSYLSSTRKCCLSCFLCQPETLPYPLSPRLTLPFNSFMAPSGIFSYCVYWLHFYLLYVNIWLLCLCDSLIDVWLPNHQIESFMREEKRIFFVYHCIPNQQ